MQASVNHRLDKTTRHATHLFMHRIRDCYNIREAILFGSRARQTHNTQSDADIAIILKAKSKNQATSLKNRAVKDMAAVAFHVMMDTGVMVEALPLWDYEIDHPETYTNPALIKNILNDGILL